MSFGNYKNIIIHCGIHKTGTSYIQSVLKDNTDALLQNKIHYPKFTTRNGHAHEGNHSVIAVSYDSAMNADANFSRFVDMGIEADTLLISGEEISREERSGKILSDIVEVAPDANIKIVIYLRRVDHMIESVYAEAVKARLTGNHYSAGYQLNYTKIVDVIENIVGRQNISVRPYNKNLWVNGLLGDDFMSAIGFEGLWSSMKFSKDRVNERLSRQQTYALSLLSQRSAKAKLLKYFFESAESDDLNDRAKFFRSPDERKRLIQNCRTLNSPLADRYGLGDIDEFLGSDDLNDDVNWVPFVPNTDLISNWYAKILNQDA